MERFVWIGRFSSVAAIGILASAAALAAQLPPSDAPSNGNGLDDQAFGELLSALSNGERSQQAALLSRVAHLPASTLVHTVASIPLARYEVKARPNAIGLRAISYTIVSDQAGEDRRLRTVLFTFDAHAEARATCARFDTARAALGMDTAHMPPPIPSLHGPTGADSVPPPITAFVALGHMEARVLTHTVARPCLVTVSIQFIEPAEDGTPGVRSYEARHRSGFQRSALQAFVGENTGRYFLSKSAPLVDQISLALSIPDDVERMAQRSFTLGRGYALTIGCRQHSCQEKAAVISDARGAVVRAALISKKCGEEECNAPWTLTIFKNSAQMGAEDDQDMLDEVLLNWAQEREPGIPHEIVELG